MKNKKLGRLVDCITTMALVLIVFLISDIVFGGLLALVVLIWDSSLAFVLFRNFVIIMFVMQILIVVTTSISNFIRKG